MSNTGFVIALSGSPGSGKTTLANHLAIALSCRRAGFGDYIRSVASERGIDDSRTQLQELGEHLFNQGVESFCSGFLRYAEWGRGKVLVVEGVRHSEVVYATRRLIGPAPLLLVFVSSDPNLRQERVDARDKTRSFDVLETARHSTEVQVETLLPHLADIVVDGQRPSEELCAQIVVWLKSKIYNYHSFDTT